MRSVHPFKNDSIWFRVDIKLASLCEEAKDAWGGDDGVRSDSRDAVGRNEGGRVCLQGGDGRRWARCLQKGGNERGMAWGGDGGCYGGEVMV